MALTGIDNLAYTKSLYEEAFNNPYQGQYLDDNISDDDEQDNGSNVLNDAETQYDPLASLFQEIVVSPPNIDALKRAIGPLSGPQLLQITHLTQTLFHVAVEAISSTDVSARVIENALTTLKAFLRMIFSKQYHDFSASILSVLTPYESIDNNLIMFVDSIDYHLKIGSMETRCLALEVALTFTVGSFQSTLPSYFMQRDLFAGINLMIGDNHASDESVATASTLLGVLSHFNPELNNPYQYRLRDFVNTTAMERFLHSILEIYSKLSTEYYEVINDDPSPGVIGSLLTYIGKSMLHTRAPVYSYEESKELFARMPKIDIGISLPLYDLINNNKYFLSQFIGNQISVESPSEFTKTPFTEFLTLTSYLLAHQNVSGKATSYAYLHLMTIHSLLYNEKAKNTFFCSNNCLMTIKICHQGPHIKLPYKRSPSFPIVGILDCIIVGLDCNLKRRMNVRSYSMLLSVLSDCMACLTHNKVRLNYNWPILWQSLITLVHFCVTYAADIRSINGVSHMAHNLLNVIVISLTVGDAFLAKTTDFDDLFYKVIHSGSIFRHFSVIYDESDPLIATDSQVILNIIDHYQSLIAKSSLQPSNLTSEEVSSIIRMGYETLSVENTLLEQTDLRFSTSINEHRSNDERIFLKKLTLSWTQAIRENWN